MARDADTALLRRDAQARRGGVGLDRRSGYHHARPGDDGGPGYYHQLSRPIESRSRRPARRGAPRGTSGAAPKARAQSLESPAPVAQAQSRQEEALTPRVDIRRLDPIALLIALVAAVALVLRTPSSRGLKSP